MSNLLARAILEAALKDDEERFESVEEMTEWALNRLAELEAEDVRG